MKFYTNLTKKNFENITTTYYWSYRCYNCHIFELLLETFYTKFYNGLLIKQ